MTSVIIPCYKNKQDLYKTIFSFGITPEVEIIIVDDCSGDRYEDIQEYFAPFYPITIIYREKNGGPGCARNDGIKAAKGKYIVFIDCGDVFENPLALLAMIENMEASPSTLITSYAHLEERPPAEYSKLEYIHPSNNRLHGKIFKTDFIKNNNITFSETCSYINEDIGFCIICKMIIASYNSSPETPYLIEDEEVRYIWSHNPNSLVRKNDYEFYYIKQNIGLACNSLHAINYAKKHNIPQEIIDSYICQHLAFMYVTYIATSNAIEKNNLTSLAGCQYYYNMVLPDFNKIDPNIITMEAQHIIAEAYQDTMSPFYNKLVSITYPQFLQELENNRIQGNRFYEQILLDQLARH